MRKPATNMNEFNFNTIYRYENEQQQQLEQQQPPQPQQQQMLYQQLQHMPQPHMMPTPSAAPWNLDAMPWALASTSAAAQPGKVMRFGVSTNSGSISAIQAPKQRTQLHQKRKSQLVLSVPPKQFISEERFTAHFDGMHISSDYHQSMARSNTSGDDISDDIPSTSAKFYKDYQVSAQELEQKLKKANRITVCEEIKKLQEEHKKASFLPEVLMNRIVQPCTALVLWKPPPILELLQRQPDNCEQDDISDVDLDTELDVCDDYSETDAADAEIDDFIDNNNTCSLDFNNLKPDGMDEDL